MTTEQAIKELKSDRELYGSDIVYAGDGTPEGDLMLALDMGIAALKKQIPENPISEERYYICPCCRGDLGVSDDDIFVYELPTPKYCGDCGQALDWSDTDEMPNIKSKE